MEPDAQELQPTRLAVVSGTRLVFSRESPDARESLEARDMEDSGSPVRCG
jgi:hypothetical protein